MNGKGHKQVVFVLILAVAFVLSACGTLEIDTEPTTSETEVAVTTSGASQVTMIPEIEETNAVDEVIPTPVEVSAEVDTVEEVSETPNKASEIIDLDETWNLFLSHELGFSIKFPKEMAAMVGSCYWNEEQESYRLEMAFRPVGIFEDADAVYIAPQHYFELAGERVDGGKHYYDECNQITNSLELLREEREMSMVQFWQLVVEEIHDEDELDSFIKARYFSGCSLGEQSASNQDGVYDVQIQGDGLGLDGTCPMNYGYKVKYFPSGGRVIAWNTGQAPTFLSAVDWSAGYDFEMIESFQFLTGTSVETAEVPLATVGYSNSETGIAFNYPTSWAMEEEAYTFVFRKGTVTLRLRYKMPGQAEWGPGRTGMGGTGVGALVGTAKFLGQSLDRYGVYYDDVLILVVYGGEPGTIVQSGAMEFTIVLEDTETDYKTLTVTDEVQAEAEMILASFAVGSTQSGPAAGLNTYLNSEYGFALNYPSSWTIAEVNDLDFVGPGSRSVQLSQGTVTLVIGYRRAVEEVALSGSGAPGGEFEVRGTTRMLGRDVERYVIVYEGKDKVVMYGQPGSGPHALGGLEFSARLDDFNPDYDNAALSQTVQDEADMILGSLAIIEAEGESDSGDAGDAYAGWRPYANELLGYSLMVPGAAEVVSLDPNERVAFIGPEVEGKPLFQFMVVHYEVDATEAANFMQSLVEGHRAFLESIGETTVGQVEELVVAGEPAIKLRFPVINESDPRDDYFFVHDDKVFTISITHIDGVEIEDLNDLFLQSFAFE